MITEPENIIKKDWKIKMKVYNKFGRNLIPQIIEKDGKKFDIHIAENEEYGKLLEGNWWKKLMNIWEIRT